MNPPTGGITRLLPDAPRRDLASYEAAGGRLGLAAAHHLGPDATIEALADAGLRGRGGAGFPTAIKWRSVHDGGPGTRYVVCNAAEGEPGTFKDRALLRSNPFAVLEGVLIAAHALDAPIAVVALKASATAERDALRRALGELADGNRCYLPVQARDVVASVLRAFPDDVAAHLEGWCPSSRSSIPTPKVLDLVDGRVVLDERQDRKRPDWTYEP